MNRRLNVVPGTRGSMRVDTGPDPIGSGAVLARTRAVGICGTDLEIAAGNYGWPAQGQARLVIGHESLMQVVEAPQDSGLAPGDLIVGIVRRPDPVPCACCAAGEWDMCRNGFYTERGIKQLDGFAADWVRIEPEYVVKVHSAVGLSAVLLEPASILAKAWDHVYRIGGRAASWEPASVLVTGAGPIGLLAALMGRQRGLDVHVFDRAQTGLKPDLVAALGAHYHAGDIGSLAALRPDVVIECTGAGPLLLDALEHTASAGIVCLAGVSSGGHKLELDLGMLNRQMVLENDVVFGSVNANRAHYQLAAEALARAEPEWLSRLITRRVPLTRWSEAFERRPDDVKVVLDFEA